MALLASSLVAACNLRLDVLEACSGDVECGESRWCLGGYCRGCPTCEEGTACARGSCLPTRCAGGPCGDGLVCADSVCVDATCVGVECPPATFCGGGTCQACQTRETSCTGGTDEDCDGKTDCDDPDCLGVRCGADLACGTRVCGASGLCMPTPGLAGAVCRPAAGACDVAEVCDGASVACPADGFEGAGTVCRAQADACDVVEACTGSSADCPADGVEPSGVLCRASIGACDVAEVCDGASGACPVDAFESAGRECRPSANACDAAESCSGASPDCPADGVAPAGHVCRPSTTTCDLEEVCDGLRAACPADFWDLACGTVRVAFVGPGSVTSGSCTPYAVEARDGQGAASPVEAATPVDLSEVGDGAFYSDGSCNTATSTVTIAAGSNSATVYFRDDRAEGATLSASTTALGSAVLDVAVNAGPATWLALGGPSTVVVGTCSTVFAVQRRDGFGNTSPEAVPMVVNLSAIGSAVLFAGTGCTTTSGAAVTVTIPAGETSALFCLVDVVVEMTGINASSGTLDPASIEVAVVQPRPGTLDPGFGVGGRVTIKASTGDDYAQAVAVQPDGRIVVGGVANETGDGAWCLVRLLADGAADPSFGTAGRVTTNLGPRKDRLYALELQPDGRIVAAGFLDQSGNNDAALARYLPGGALDTSFNGTGKLTVDFAGGHDELRDVHVLPDGSIVAAGVTTADFNATYDLALLKRTADGSPDLNFGNTIGDYSIDFGGPSEFGQALLAIPNGQLLVAGSSYGGPGRMLLTLLRDTAVPDQHFGAGGWTVTPGPAGVGIECNAAALQPPRSIVCAGTVQVGGISRFALARYDDTGALDASFGTEGLVTTAVGALGDRATSVLVLPGGKIVVAGFTDTGTGAGFDVAVVRHLADGALDTGFGSSGLVVLPANGLSMIGGEDVRTALALDAAGRVLVAANARGITGDRDILVARIWSSGPASRLAVTSSAAASLVANACSEPFTVEIQDADGNPTTAVDDIGAIVSAGAATVSDDSLCASSNPVAIIPIGASRATFRLRDAAESMSVVASAAGLAPGSMDVKIFPAGSGLPDPSFGNNGVATVNVSSSSDHAAAIAVQPDGKVVVAGFGELAGNGRWVVARLVSSGMMLDPSFGSAGLAWVDFGPMDDLLMSMALVPSNGGIVAAGFRRMGGDNDFVLARWTSSGALDSSFNGTGTVRLDFHGLNHHDGSSCLALRPDGRVVVAGAATQDDVDFGFALARFRSDGSLDPAFGSGGTVFTATAGASEWISGVALQTDGRVVASGASKVAGLEQFLMARYLDTGAPDPAFGAGGRVATTFGAGTEGNGFGVAVQPDGRIVQVGRVLGAGGAGSAMDFALVRTLANGTLDSSFGAGGKLVVSLSPGYDGATSVVLQPDGKIVVAGYAQTGKTHAVAVARFLSDGAPDVSFGAGGRTMLATDSDVFHQHDDDLVVGLTLDASGRILVSANRCVATACDFFVARLLP